MRAAPSDPWASPLYSIPVVFENAGPKPFSITVARDPAYRTDVTRFSEPSLHEERNTPAKAKAKRIATSLIETRVRCTRPPHYGPRFVIFPTLALLVSV